MKYEDFYKQMNALKDEERKVTSKMYGIGWLKEIKMIVDGSLQADFYPTKKDGKKSNKYRCVWGIKLEDIKTSMI